MLGLAEIALERGDLQDAGDRVCRYVRRVSASNRLGRAAALELACFAAGVLARARGELEDARTCLDDAVFAYERAGTPFEAARARLELAAVRSALERPDHAQAEASHARQTLDRLRARGPSDPGHADEAPAALTPRQTEVLRLVARGMSDAEIASALCISTHTVHRHVANILLRLNAPTRAAAAAQAATSGLL